MLNIEMGAFLMKNLILPILNKFNSDKQFSEIQLREIQYSILVIASDFSKFLLLLIGFSLFNYGKVFLYAFAATTLLRIYIGGSHFNTYLKCLIFSTLYFSLLIVLPLRIENFNQIIIISCLSTLALVLLAPQLPKNSQRVLKISNSTIKLITLFICCGLLLIYISKRDPLTSMGPFTIMLQALQLFIMKGVSSYDSKKRQ